MMGEGKEREGETLVSNFFLPWVRCNGRTGTHTAKPANPASRRKGDKRFWVVISLFSGRESASLGLCVAGARVVRQGC